MPGVKIKESAARQDSGRSGGEQSEEDLSDKTRRQGLNPREIVG
jgi:hypothetical protein